MPKALKVAQSPINCSIWSHWSSQKKSSAQSIPQWVSNISNIATLSCATFGTFIDLIWYSKTEWFYKGTNSYLFQITFYYTSSNALTYSYFEDTKLGMCTVSRLVQYDSDPVSWSTICNTLSLYSDGGNEAHYFVQKSVF